MTARRTIVAVSAEELEAALDALLGNVFTHTPEGTAFRLLVFPRPGGGVRLAVEDDGPGVSGDLVARGASGAGSTGLGLDIARRTAEAAGGVFRIGRSAAGGARIAMEFPTTGPQPRRLLDATESGGYGIRSKGGSEDPSRVGVAQGPIRMTRSVRPCPVTSTWMAVCPLWPMYP